MYPPCIIIRNDASKTRFFRTSKFLKSLCVLYLTSSNIYVKNYSYCKRGIILWRKGLKKNLPRQWHVSQEHKQKDNNKGDITSTCKWNFPHIEVQIWDSWRGSLVTSGTICRLTPYKLHSSLRLSHAARLLRVKAFGCFTAGPNESLSANRHSFLRTSS